MKGKIFNAQEVQAIISGNKRQFTEVKVQPNSDRNTTPAGFIFTGIWGDGAKENRRECPYQIGQKIFVKESFSSYYEDDAFVRGDIFLYRADEDSKDLEDVHWKPAQHMKQEHSRLTLLIKEIRVERLQDISEEDAIAEGFKNTFVGFQHPVYNPGRTANQDFEIFWNATHKKPEEKFEANPLVWVISFGVLHASEMFNVSISTKF